jgi:hypothetical protein
MPRPLRDSPFPYGFHEAGGEQSMLDVGTPGSATGRITLSSGPALSGIGARAGDFDLATPTEAQISSAAQLITALLDQLGLDVNDVFGRSEVERGTTSPGLQWGQGVRYRDELLARAAGQVAPVSRFDIPRDVRIMATI